MTLSQFVNLSKECIGVKNVESAVKKKGEEESHSPSRSEDELELVG
jgi:hypothetical protein